MKALLIVDIQYDFLPGGALEVPQGDVVIPVANRLQDFFELVVATQDWHPPDHASFASNHPGKKAMEEIELDGIPQILWPDHCVQGSAGAAFSKELQMNKVEAIFRKGMEPAIDSYSGFFDNGHKKSTGMGDYLKGRNVDTVYVSGLAGDFCVNYTLNDALMLGFNAVLVEDGTKPIDPPAYEKAMHKLKEQGLESIRSSEIDSPIR
ncbi:bifunctional nicotinamidase/pyrazinamidase [Desulfopila inferna]|uniref:bifunctional nicotinamidase/pyrazinamidase n=1 Tax=Desulfopila inferna TaxID=468528 RepID=UPI0019645737|nr:bifunctional nicotinamidase/pyrazinamidase [Desulfopila inferna]MBM9605033.1 bifunctional nicotinamidase/pyrazinamidase [Desulfopila inferna]